MSVRVLTGHCIDVLDGLPAASCHVVCTSPPYYGLRSYSTPPQIWPELDGCEPCAEGQHEWADRSYYREGGNSTSSALAFSEAGQANADRLRETRWKHDAICTRCGSWRGELGSEPDVSRYLDNLILVFRAVRRVLRPDGSLWINLAGSFHNDPGGQNGGAGNTLDYRAGRVSRKIMAANAAAGRQHRVRANDLGLKRLDWVDVPGLFAARMVKDGWYWRADMVLIKRSPLPESVTGTAWTRCRVKVAPSPTPRLGDPGEFGGYPKKQRGPDAPPNGGGPYGGAAEWADCPGCPRCAPNDGLILRRGNWRPTRATERLLLFVQRPEAYFDQQAVRQEAKYGRREWNGVTPHAVYDALSTGERLSYRTGGKGDDPSAGRNPLDWMTWNQREPLVKLRSDLTPEQRAYVLQRLAEVDS